MMGVLHRSLSPEKECSIAKEHVPINKEVKISLLAYTCWAIYLSSLIAGEEALEFIKGTVKYSQIGRNR